MYYYEVGYWSFEETPNYTLINEKEFTKEQFNELVSNCMTKIFKAKKEVKDISYNVSSILSATIKMLEDDFGFKRPIIKARFLPFGWADLENKTDWDTEVKGDVQLELIRSKISKI